jgi:dolichol-phosphate mannosyltransferase
VVGKERVAAVVPAYRVERHIEGVVRTVPPWVDDIIVVDDGSGDLTADTVIKIGEPRVRVLRHARNQGVGAAMRSGYGEALQRGADLVIKIDGDGQMDPAQLEKLVEPLASRRADYCKGNRFHDWTALRTMPLARRLGNIILSFLTKAASGYWNTSDPTNGYTAIRKEALQLINLNRLHSRYFFESGLLIQLGTLKAVIEEVPMPARYGDERSSMSLVRVALTFPGYLAMGLLRRIYWRYFFYEMTATSIFLAFGLIMLLFGLLFGSIRWYESWLTGTPQTAGTVLLAALPFMLGFQMILQAIVLDVQDQPSQPLCRVPPAARRWKPTTLTE